MKAKNPQAFQKIQNLIKNTNNPQEYLNEFNIGDYERLEWDSLTIMKEQCYYNNEWKRC